MFLIDTPVCTGCGECINVCPVDAITLQNAKAVIDQSLCRQCGVCVNQCPVQAISEDGPMYVTQHAQQPPLSQEQPGILARVLDSAGNFFRKGSRSGGAGGGRGRGSGGGGGRAGSGGGGGRGSGRGAGGGRGRGGRK